MREALKTNISKYGPKTDSAITIENVKGKGLQLVVVFAGKKHYVPLSAVPLSPDEHANHPNHQKVRVDHGGNVGLGIASPNAKLTVEGTISLKEQSDDAAHVAGYSQVWVDDAGAGTLMFTNDSGTKFTVDVSAV